MAIVSNPSEDGFNSYVSVEEADDYFAGTYFGASKKWTKLEPSQQEAVLISATRKLSNLAWAGKPASEYQVLPFPRLFVGEYGYSYFPNVSPVPISGWVPVDAVDPDGTMAEEFIPVWLKQATFEMAQWLWTEEERPATDVEFAMLKSSKTGPLDYQFRDSMGLPPSVLAILQQLGPTVIDLRTGPRSMTMVF